MHPRCRNPVTAGVGPDLVGKTDAPAFLAKVEHHACAQANHVREGLVELIPAITLEGAEHLAGETFGMYPHRQPGFAGDVPIHERNVFAVAFGDVSNRCTKDVHGKNAVRRGQFG